jgi:hypothetical protein
MSDVVPFPGVTDATGASDDAGELDRNERDAEAFRDLEGPISDCRVMAQIAHQIASDEKGLSAELTYSIFHTPIAQQAGSGLSGHVARRGDAMSSELTPQHVLVDLFEELLVQNPEELTAIVIERLRDAGFVIVPADRGSTAGPVRSAAPEETHPCQLTQLLRL